MTTAIVSDVHGNLPALEACLKEIARLGCTRIYCLGDTFGYLPEGQACFELLQDARAQMLLGNHEAMLLGRLRVDAEVEALVQLDPCRRELASSTRSAIEALLPFRELVVADRRFLLVHGTPADPLQGYAYPDADHSWMDELPYDYVLMGNTHRAFVHDLAGVQVVNVGSVGLPRDEGNASSFATVDDATAELMLHRVPIDVGAVRDRYPDAHPSVLSVFDRRAAP